jgi:predicted O-methyltransferase YrrM
MKLSTTLSTLRRVWQIGQPMPSPYSDYSRFYRHFGGAARSKHTVAPDDRTTRRDNKRPYLLPETCDLPREFIRLCPWEMEFLFTVARRAKRGIVEIGRFNGGSTFVLACANPHVPIWSIDIKPQNDAFLREQFARFGVGANVQLIVGDSRKTRDDVADYDFLFIDGDHSYEGCSADIAAWTPRLAAPGHLVFHDSYLGDYGVQDAIADFIERHADISVLTSPFIGAEHWHYPAGSMSHLMRTR